MTDHHARTIRCADKCGCIHCYSDHVCAATERWLGTALLVLGALLFIGVGGWWTLAGIASLFAAGLWARRP